MWKLLAHSPGIDVTLALNQGRVIGVSLGFFIALEDEIDHRVSQMKIYVTYATAVHTDWRAKGPDGQNHRIGRKLREAQVEAVRKKHGMDVFIRFWLPEGLVGRSSRSRASERGVQIHLRGTTCQKA